MKYSVKASLLIILISLLIFSCNNTAQKKDVLKEEQCCEIELTETPSKSSEITCPKCGHTEIEKLPTEVCLIKYNCKNCDAELTPKEGDCCVYCTYGTHKCPSMQVQE